MSHVVVEGAGGEMYSHGVPDEVMARPIRRNS